MAFATGKHHRRSIRLKGYDYSSPGYYFVTVCTRDRQCLLGDVIDGAMILNDAGNIVHSTWNDLPAHYHHVRLDAMVIMPNHIHGIIVLNGFDGSNTMIDSDVGAGLKPAPTIAHCQRSGCQHPRHGLSEIIRGFKTFSARKINWYRRRPGVAVWQRNFYDHIIRNTSQLERIRRYIQGNPENGLMDQYSPTLNVEPHRPQGGALNVERTVRHRTVQLNAAQRHVPEPTPTNAL